MEKRIVTRGKRGEVIRIVEYFEPHLAAERKLKRRIRGWAWVFVVGILVGGILHQLIADAKAEWQRPYHSRF